MTSARWRLTGRIAARASDRLVPPRRGCDVRATRSPQLSARSFASSSAMSSPLDGEERREAGGRYGCAAGPGRRGFALLEAVQRVQRAFALRRVERGAGRGVERELAPGHLPDADDELASASAAAALEARANGRDERLDVVRPAVVGLRNGEAAAWRGGRRPFDDPRRRSGLRRRTACARRRTGCASLRGGRWRRRRASSACAGDSNERGKRERGTHAVDRATGIPCTSPS